MNDPTCCEARSVIAIMAAILLAAPAIEGDSYNREDSVREAQRLYDDVVATVGKRHRQGSGKGKGSYPAP